MPAVAWTYTPDPGFTGLDSFYLHRHSTGYADLATPTTRHASRSPAKPTATPAPVAGYDSFGHGRSTHQLTIDSEYTVGQ